MQIPNTRKEKIYYISCRQIAIEKNKTGDVFCSRCFSATEGTISHCCGEEIITKEEALLRIGEIWKRWRDQE
jgi:hypothetical protein